MLSNLGKQEATIIQNTRTKILKFDIVYVLKGELISFKGVDVIH